MYFYLKVIGHLSNPISILYSICRKLVRAYFSQFTMYSQLNNAQSASYVSSLKKILKALIASDYRSEPCSVIYLLAHPRPWDWRCLVLIQQPYFFLDVNQRSPYLPDEVRWSTIWPESYVPPEGGFMCWACARLIDACELQTASRDSGRFTPELLPLWRQCFDCLVGVNACFGKSGAWETNLSLSEI